MAAAGLLLAVTALPASAIDTGKGTPGYCPDATGITVVIDFQELGGTTIVRCAQGDQATGHAALKNAGVQIAGTSRWGEALVCRIEGKPGANDESCKDTPPPGARWSYWYAPNGGAWKYSEWGAMDRKPPPGSFEGWSFSKDKTDTTTPPPRIAPIRPGGQSKPPPPPPPAAPPQPPPNNPAPPPAAVTTTQPAPTSAPPPSSALPSTSESTTSSLPPPTAGTAENGVEWTGDPQLASNKQDSGLPVAVVIGGVVILALTVGAGVTVHRRKRNETQS
jgi:hypothetical protein